MIAKQNTWRPILLLHANSGDISGDKSSVVGYASIIFVDENDKELTEGEQDFLLKLARQSAEEYLRTGKKLEVEENKLTPSLRKVQGCFTTFNKNKQLRGCVGHIIPQEELYKCVMDNAINAAVNDRRFEPVELKEMKDIEIEISVLTIPKKLVFSSGEDLKNKLRPNIDGLVLRNNWRSSTYLPQVWGQLPEKDIFLSSLCEKGGMPPDCWKSNFTEAYTYQAVVFSE
jgi:AmmeMemoRadiSam system protein A